MSNALNLIFFVLFFMTGCQEREPKPFAILWKNNRAIALLIPSHGPPNSLTREFQVKLHKSREAMLGNYTRGSDNVIFTPLVPFTRGLHYEVLGAGRSLGRVLIPADKNAKSPRLLAVYPAGGTIPENLLKYYLIFSAPMREGVALQHIFLKDSSGNIVRDIFLDLQPELWNSERTVLTVWLDPGRIKRDLIPNRKLGNPLINGQHYTLSLLGGWRDVHGIPLRDTLAARYLVGQRDTVSPRLKDWNLALPLVGTVTPLRVETGESLDYFVLLESIRLADEGGQAVDGVVEVNDRLRIFSFTPAHAWRGGTYFLRADKKLEDLAGNNLERVFDRDLQGIAPTPPARERSFTLIR